MEVAAFANVQLPSDLDHLVPEQDDLLEWPHVNHPDVVEFNPQELALEGFDFSHIRPVDEDVFMDVITTDPFAPVTKIDVFDDTESDVTPPEDSPADVLKSDSSADVSPQEGSPTDVLKSDSSADVSPEEGSPADVLESDSSADVSPEEGSPADVLKSDSSADVSPEEGSPADVLKSDSSADVSPEDGSPADVLKSDSSANVSPQEGSPSDVLKSDSSADVSPQEDSPSVVPPQEGSPADVTFKADMPAVVPPKYVKIKLIRVFTYVIKANHPLHSAILRNLIQQRQEASDPSLAQPLKIPIEHKNQIKLELNFSSLDDDEKQNFQQCRMSNCTNRNHPRFCFTILCDRYVLPDPPVYNYYCCHLYKTQIDPLPTEYRFTLKMEKWEEIDFDLHSQNHRILSTSNPLDYDPSQPSAFLLLRKCRGKTKVPGLEAFEVLGALKSLKC